VVIVLLALHKLGFELIQNLVIVLALLEFLKGQVSCYLVILPKQPLGEALVLSI